MTETGVLIIGAGQQGLALGRELKEQGKKFVILEAAQRVGDRWRGHYDSLVLFTPRRYSALPGLAMEGDQKGYATKDEFADYLESYAAHFGLPVELGTRVEQLSKEGSRFVAKTPRGEYVARSVVLATGYGKAFIPDPAFSGFSIHSSAYRNPAQIPGNKVLVVGNGNSASQIALELAESRETHIAMREMPRMLPRTILGKSFYWWGDTFGLSRIPSDSFLGKLVASDKDFVVGHALSRALRARTLISRPGLDMTSDTTVVFEDGSEERYDAIIFATGFLPDYSWLDVPGALNSEGNPIHKKGVSPVPELYFAGLRNQLTSISSNIYGANYVAQYLARHFSPRRNVKPHYL